MTMMKAESNEDKTWTLPDLIADKTPQPQAIIGGGILNAQSLLLIAGQQKAKKSFLAMNMAVAIAAGKSFAHFSIHKPHRVLVLSAEGGFHSNKARVIKMCSHFQRPADDMLYFNFGTRMKLDNKIDCEGLMKMVDEIKPDVVVIDPLVKFHTKDENSAQEMSQVLGVIRNLIDGKKVSVILVHHMGKTGDSGARGSSAILGEYDAYIQIEKKKDKQKLKFDMRHAETPDPMDIKFNPETFWFESGVQANPIIQFLQTNGALSKTTLADKLVEAGMYASRNAAYSRISKELKSKSIAEQNKLVCLN